MPTVVDNRVVEMVFNNKQFEQGVATSMNTLDKLKKALSFSSTVSNFGEVTKSFDRFNSNTLSELSAHVDNISTRFSNWGIVGMEVLRNLTNKAVDFVGQALEPITSSLREIDLLTMYSQGWSKYAENTQAVQTIMSSTRDTWEEQAKAAGEYASQLEFVEDVMSGVRWFADETSYSLTDMTSSMAKFTSKNVDLQTSASMVEGISLLAASAGQNTDKAAAAMYNFAQAFGLGYVGMQDWRSIINASMDTTEFKNAAIDAAVAAGTLVDEMREIDGQQVKVHIVNDGDLGTEDETIVSLQHFEETLRTKWFSSSVLTSVLNKYSNAATILHDIYTDYGVVATDFLDAYDAIVSAETSDKKVERMEEAANNLLIPVEDLATIVDKLSSEEYAIGMNAFRRGMEAITLGQALTSTADAVSSQWLAVFEAIFGNYEEATRLWTDLTMALWDMYAGPVEKIAEAFTEWKALGGRDAFWEGVYRIWDEMSRLGPTIVESLEKWNILTPSEEWGKNLYSSSLSFRDSINAFFDTNWDKILNTVSNIVSIFSLGLNIGKQVISSIVTPIKSYLFPLIQNAFNAFDPEAFFSPIVSHLQTISDTIENKIAPWLSSRLTSLLKSITDYGSSILNFIKAIGKSKSYKIVFGWVRKLTAKVADFVSLKIVDFIDFLTSIVDKATELVPIVDDFVASHLPAIKDFFVNIIPTAKSYLQPMIDGFKGLGEAIGEVAGKIAEFLMPKDTGEVGFFGKVAHAIGSALSWIGGILKKVGPALSSAFNWVVNTVRNIGPSVSNFFTQIGDALEKATEKVKEFFKEFKMPTLEELFSLFRKGTAGILVIELIKLFGNKGLGGLMKLLKDGKLFDGLKSSLESLLEPLKDLFGKKSIDTDAIKVLAQSMLLLAAAAFVFSTIDSKKMTSALSGLAAAMGEFVVLYGTITAFSDKMPDSKKGPLGTLMDSFAISNNRKSQSGFMLKIAASLLIFGLALKSLSDLNWPQIINGLFALASAALILTMTMVILEKAGAKASSSSSILIASLGLLALAGVMKIFATFKWDEIIDGLKTMAASLLILTVSLAVLGLVGPGVIAGAASLLLASLALLPLSLVLRTLTNLSWDKIKQGLQAMGIALIVLTASLAILGLIGPGIVLGAAALAIAVIPLLELAGLLRLLVGLKWDEIADGLKAMGLSLAALTGALALLGLIPFGILGGAALVLAAAGMVILALALKEVAKIPAASLERAVDAISASLEVMTASLQKLKWLGKRTLMASVGIIVLTASLLLLVDVFKAMNTLSGEEVTAALDKISEALGVFTKFGIILGVISPLMTGAAIAMLLFGAGLLVITTALLGFVGVMATFGGALGVLGAIITVVLLAIIATIPPLFIALADGIAAFVVALVGYADEILGALTELLIDILKMLTELVGPLVELVYTIGKELIYAIADLAVDLVVAVSDAILEILQYFAEKIDDFVEAAVLIALGFITGFLRGLAEGLPDIIQASWDLTVAFVDGIANGIDGNWDRLMEAVKHLGKSIINAFVKTIGLGGIDVTASGEDIMDQLKQGIVNKFKDIKEQISNLISKIGEWLKEKWDDIKNVGGNIINGFVEGIGEKAGELARKAKEVVDNVVGSVRRWLGIESPSRVFAEIGEFSILGLAKGLSDNTKLATDSAEDVGINVSNALSQALQNASASVEDVSPVITPIVDMSNVNDSSRQIAGMFGGVASGMIGLSGSARVAALSSMNAEQLGAYPANSAYNVGAINFTINPQPGQNPEEIADEVMNRLNTTLLRGKAAWA